MAHTERVVITGFGILAANGIGAGAFWESLLAGRSGIGLVTLFDASALDSRIAGEVKNFVPADYRLAPQKIGRESRNTQLAIAAASLAVEHAGLDLAGFGPRPTVPVVMGVSTSSFDIIQEAVIKQHERGPRFALPQVVGSSGIHMPAKLIADQIGVATHATTIATACAAGQDAIAQAAAMIRSGQAEVAIAGGSDAPISLAPYAHFSAVRMLSRRNDDPTHASRPFDLERDGGVVAEGSAVLVLENLAHALARGATPWAEIIAGATCIDDKPEVHGSGLAESMRLALANACCLPEDIDHISAHGPSDPVLDRVESAMIRQVFGKRHAYRVAISSIKGVTGNALAAAGAMQTVAACLALRHQIVPMTANFVHADPACDLDYVTGGSRPQPVNMVMVNNHGMSGTNSSLVLRRWTRS